jgi:hypothetical protein
LTTRIKGKVTKLADRHTGRRSTPKRRTKKIHTNATKSCILRSWLPNVHGDEASIVVTPDATPNRNRIHKTKDFRLHYSFGTVEAPTSPTDNDGRQRVASAKVNGNQAKAAARSSTPSLDQSQVGMQAYQWAVLHRATVARAMKNFDPWVCANSMTSSER